MTVHIDLGDTFDVVVDETDSHLASPADSTIRWFRRTLVATRASSEWDRLVSAGHLPSPGAGGVLFVPTGNTGSIFGMSAQTTTLDCLAGVYEGLVHAAVARIREVIPQIKAIELTSVSDGAGLWARTLADTAGAPVFWQGTGVVPDEAAAHAQARLAVVYRAYEEALRTTSAAEHSG